MRLKNVDVGEGSLSPEQITEFIDQMQVYEGAMYELSLIHISEPTRP